MISLIVFILMFLMIVFVMLLIVLMIIDISFDNNAVIKFFDFLEKIFNLVSYSNFKKVFKKSL